MVLGLVACSRAYARPEVRNSSRRASPFFSKGVRSTSDTPGGGVAIAQKFTAAVGLLHAILMFGGAEETYNEPLCNR